jgi:hypothetical protein
MISQLYNIPVNSHFIISAPRSGTTWLSRMLNSHPQMACVERRLFGGYADFIKDDGVKDPRLRVTMDKYINSMLLHHGIPFEKNDELLNTFIKALVKEERKYTGKRVIIDKITPYLDSSHIVLKSISKFFPDARIIYLLRDGRDVLTSGVFHWLTKHEKGQNLNNFEKLRKETIIEKKQDISGPFFQKKEICKWANEWKQPLQAVNEFKSVFPVKIIKYEDLLVHPEEILKTCFDFLKVRSTKKILRAAVESGSFKEMSNGRNRGESDSVAHVRKGISGDWKNYFSYEDAKLFHEISGDLLLEYEYEINPDWFERFG